MKKILWHLGSLELKKPGNLWPILLLNWPPCCSLLFYLQANGWILLDSKDFVGFPVQRQKCKGLTEETLCIKDIQRTCFVILGFTGGFLQHEMSPVCRFRCHSQALSGRHDNAVGQSCPGYLWQKQNKTKKRTRLARFEVAFCDWLGYSEIFTVLLCIKPLALFRF